MQLNKQKNLYLLTSAVFCPQQEIEEETDCSPSQEADRQPVVERTLSAAVVSSVVVGSGGRQPVQIPKLRTH